MNLVGHYGHLLLPEYEFDLASGQWQHAPASRTCPCGSRRPALRRRASSVPVAPHAPARERARGPARGGAEHPRARPRRRRRRRAGGPSCRARHATSACAGSRCRRRSRTICTRRRRNQRRSAAPHRSVIGHPAALDRARLTGEPATAMEPSRTSIRTRGTALVGLIKLVVMSDGNVTEDELEYVESAGRRVRRRRISAHPGRVRETLHRRRCHPASSCAASGREDAREVIFGTRP